MKAFSLVELLVVVAIVGILIAMGGVAISGATASSRISQALETANGVINNARQHAVTRNADVEVRLLELPSRSGGDSTPRLRALQLLEISEDGTFRPLGKVRHLPGGAVISDSPVLTTFTLLPAAAASASHGDPSIPGVGLSYSYRAFRFRPDGSANLNTLTNLASHHLTIVEEAAASAAEVPANFATLQVEPPTGATVIYRP